MPHPLGPTQQYVLDVLGDIALPPATCRAITDASWETEHRRADVDPLDYDRTHGTLQALVQRGLVDRLDTRPAGYRLTPAGRQATTQPTQPPSRDSDVVDRVAQLLRAPDWPGACGLEDIAEIVATVRDLTPDPDATWEPH